MLKKLGFNGIKRLQFISSTLVVFVYLLRIFASTVFEDIVLHTIAIIPLLFYVFSMFLYAFSVGAFKDRTKVVIDEMSKQNETKASQSAYMAITVMVFVGVIISEFTERNISLSYDALFCILVGLSALRDGFYLLLERGGGKKDAGTDD